MRLQPPSVAGTGLSCFTTLCFHVAHLVNIRCHSSFTSNSGIPFQKQPCSLSPGYNYEKETFQLKTFESKQGERPATTAEPQEDCDPPPHSGHLHTPQWGLGSDACLRARGCPETSTPSNSLNVDTSATQDPANTPMS